MINRKTWITAIKYAVIVFSIMLIVAYKAYWGFIPLIAFLIGPFFYKEMKASTDEFFIDFKCDPNAFLTRIEKKNKEANDSLYLLKKAYAYIHLDMITEATEAYSKFDISEMNKDNQFYYMYIIVQTHMYYIDKEKEKLTILIDELQEDELLIIELKEYAKVYLGLLGDDKVSVVEQLKTAIPLQKKRIQLLELEYLLAKQYFDVAKYLDSAFVAEFMSKKKFHSIYIEKCKDIVIEAKKQIPEETE